MWLNRLFLLCGYVVEKTVVVVVVVWLCGGTEWGVSGVVVWLCG